MVDFAQTGGVIAAPFYFVTGIHHQAVMIFFVLSGYLVGGSTLRAISAGAWSWRIYGTKRLSRLLAVLLPALLLTAGWDMVGIALGGSSGYSGMWNGQVHSGPGPGNPLDLSVTTFFGNAFFLQTISVPTFGSNSPLWSLAFEFWYYVAFPLICLVLTDGVKIYTRIVSIAFLVLLACALTREILFLFPVWLFGVLAYSAQFQERLRQWVTSRTFGMAAGAVFLIALIASRVGHWSGNDQIVGAAFAAMVPWLATTDAPWKLYDRASSALSEMSYTLYLVHFPFVAFLYFVFYAPRQMRFGIGGIAMLSAIIIVTLAYASIVWWLFERNTFRVRHIFEISLLKLAKRQACKRVGKN